VGFWVVVVGILLYKKKKKNLSWVCFEMKHIIKTQSVPAMGMSSFF
jgi:hypothetical protein